MSFVSFKDVEELQIYRNGFKAGRLLRTDKGCQFVYDESFLKEAFYDGLSYQVKKNAKPIHYKGDNLPPFFAGLLPEGLRLKAVINQLKTSEDDLFSLLAATGASCIGDVYVGDQEFKELPIELPQVKNINFYDQFQKSINQDLKLKREDTFSGVQEKISASMISFPLRAAKKGKSYILKLNPKDKPNLVKNEHLTLRLAKKCGIEVNNTQLVYDKNNNAGLLVERFDRIAVEGHKSPLMVHQEDACQFLDMYPANKYRLKLSDICGGVERFASAPIIEIQKLILQYLYSYLVGNGDMHAKNISLQTHFETGQVRLTPAYDLICTYIYKDRKMALKMNAFDDNIKKKTVINFARRFNISEKAMEASLKKLVMSFQKNKNILLEAFSEREGELYLKMTKKRIADLS